MAPPSVAGAVLGALVADDVPERALLARDRARALLERVDLAFRPVAPRPRERLRLAPAVASGFAIGALGGAVGVILGTLRMPALVRAVGLDSAARPARTSSSVSCSGSPGSRRTPRALDVAWDILAAGSRRRAPRSLARRACDREAERARPARCARHRARLVGAGVRRPGRLLDLQSSRWRRPRIAARSARPQAWREELYEREPERQGELFSTISGVENEPLATPDSVEVDYDRDLGFPGVYPVHARRLPVDVPRQALDDAPVRRLRHRRGDERALPLPARPRPDRPLDGLRHADADGLRLGPRALARRGRPRGRRDRLARGHGDALRRDPARRGLDLDDDQLAGGDPARVLRRGRRAAGRAGGGAPRDDPDGHPQGVHRAEGVHLPARALDAARDGHGRVVRAGDAAVASDLDLRLPHPRGRLDRRAGARVHARRRVHLRRVGDRARARRRRLRAAALVLLQRAPRLLRGDRQVPRRAPDLGARAARALRRAQPALVADALPHADRRRLADGAAARGEHRPHRDRGARRRARRHAVAAHELVRRGARAADRGRGADRAAHAAGDRARDRASSTRSTRSAARTTSRS